jgi:hypothetical protein
VPPLSKFRPPAGRYIVSASYLNGVGIADPYAYEWFRHLEPSEILQHSLLVYDVLPFSPGWVAQCEVPRVPLDDAGIVEGTGRDDLRQITFDCAQSWIYPGGGQEEGIYALHHHLLDRPALCLPLLLPCPCEPSDPFAARHLVGARLSYEQTIRGQAPPFALFEVASRPADPAFRAAVYAVRAGTAPAAVTDLVPSNTPVAFGGPLTFLGIAACSDGDAFEVETWWEVTREQIAQPFSITVHLVTARGEEIGTADGLGVSPLALADGDVLVQRHRFGRPDEGEIWLWTGAYWLVTMERWKVTAAAPADALLVRVQIDEVCAGLFPVDDGDTEGTSR